MNERLLRDGCEAVALVGGLAGAPSSHAVRRWLEFIATPTGSCWYRAHNASIVGGYLDHKGLADAERAPERFFMNVALAHVLYTHALVATVVAGCGAAEEQTTVTCNGTRSGTLQPESNSHRSRAQRQGLSSRLNPVADRPL